jgi:hypothetical protein
LINNDAGRTNGNRIISLPKLGHETLGQRLKRLARVDSVVNPSKLSPDDISDPEDEERGGNSDKDGSSPPIDIFGDVPPLSPFPSDHVGDEK